MKPDYDAFISYSHKADGQLAPALERELKRFGIPWYRPPKLKIFRDETSLTATPELWPTIESALQNSRYFLLLASPLAATSEWVRREVGWWLEHKSHQTLLIALTDGRIKRVSGAKDFDWALTDALPDNLKGVFVETPLWVDLRWASDPKQLTPRNPQFAVAMADIAAPLRSLSKEALIGEEVNRQRRTRQTWAIFVVLIGIIAVLTHLKLVADTENALIRSQRLAQDSSNALDLDYLDLAALLSRAAFESGDTPAARKALLSALASGPILSLGNGGQPTQNVELDASCGATIEPIGPFKFLSPRIHDVAFSDDGAYVASVNDDRVIRLWHLIETSLPAIQVSSSEGFTGVGFSDDGSWIFTGANQGLTKWETRSLTAGCRLSEMDVRAFAFEPHSNSLFVGDGLGNVSRVYADSHEVEPLPRISSLESVQDIAISDDGWLAVGHEGGDVFIWNLTGGSPQTFDTSTIALADEERATAREKKLSRLAWSPSHQELAVAYDDGVVVRWDPSTLAQVGEPLLVSNGRVSELQYSSNGATLVTAGEDGRVSLWSTTDWLAKLTLGQKISSPITSIALSPDDAFLVSGTREGATLIWSATGPALSCRLKPQLACGSTLVSDIGEVLAVAFDPSSDRIAIAGNREAVRICSVAAPHSCEPSFPIDGQASSLAFSPDGSQLAVSTDSGAMLIREKGGEDKLLETPPGFVAERLTFNAAGNLLAASGTQHPLQEGKYREAVELALLWNLETGETWHELPIGEAVSALVFSPAKDTLLVARGNQMTAWSFSDDSVGQPESYDVPYVDIGALAFDVHGERLASGNDDGAVTLWRSQDRQPVWMPTSARSQGLPVTGVVHSLAFSPDGRYLASESTDGEIVLWDTEFQDRTGLLGNIGTSVLGLHWVDSRTLVAVDKRGVVHTFDIDPSSWSQQVCSVVGRDFEVSESMQYFGNESYKVCDGA